MNKERYSVEDDGIYKVLKITDTIVLKEMVIPKDLIVEAAKRYLNDANAEKT